MSLRAIQFEVRDEIAHVTLTQPLLVARRSHQAAMPQAVDRRTPVNQQPDRQLTAKALDSGGLRRTTGENRQRKIEQIRALVRRPVHQSPAKVR